jgi:Spy/CpxP family protein refolding chaperone
MKKIALVFSIIFISTAVFAQTKPKSTKELRDSIFTVMKLTDENRLKMHELIAENGNGQKAIKQDMTLTFGKKEEKMEAWKKEITVKEKAILTPEQFQIWRDFGKYLSSKPKQ